MSRLQRLFSLLSVASLAISGQAFAHAHLASSTPADQATVASPDELDLTFTEPLESAFSGVTLIGPDGQEIELGDVALQGEDKTLAVPVSAPLEPGAYEVKWHVLSSDGHKTSGDYHFSVSP